MSKGGQVEETPEERELADIGVDQRRNWETRWKPIENEFISDVMNTEPERRSALGIQAAETSRAFGKARPQLEAGLQRAGARAGSGKFAAAITGMANDEGTSRGAGAVDVESAVADNRARGLMGVLQMGQGKKADALRGLSNTADLAARQAGHDAEFAAADRAALGSAIGTGAGIAVAMQGARPGEKPGGIPNVGYEDMDPNSPLGRPYGDRWQPGL